MASQTRIPPAPITGLTGAIMTRASARMLGEVPDALGVLWHNQPVLRTSFGINRRAARWRACDQSLKTYAHMATAALVGCSFCLDLAYFRTHDEGLDETKAQQVPRWRESDLFTPLERDVMAYAEAMSQTPPTVTDQQSARLLEQLGAPALVELTAFVGLANLAARMNVALGISAQGFSSSCGLPPLAHRSAVESGA